MNIEKYTCTVEAVQWNGKNTKKVVDFCQTGTTLCTLHEVTERHLVIEPSDTMRGRSISIPKDGYAVKMKRGGAYYVVAYAFSVFHDNFKVHGN